MVLRRAREAARSGDWLRANAQYELYWDVTERDPVAVGVRRSYVVMGAKVGRSYPLDRERMRERLLGSLSRFGHTGETWWLQDAAANDDGSALEPRSRSRTGCTPQTTIAQRTPCFAYGRA